MIRTPLVRTALSVVLGAMAASPVLAQQHTAHRLGYPTTRFAEPVKTPEELRDRLTCERLRADVEVVVGLCPNWKGDVEHFRQAAATAPIRDVLIPVGARMTAMSTRRNGRLIVLQDLLWAGDAPIDAYDFTFYSKGRQYRCLTPKICCNFWVEDIGPDTRRPVLALTCTVPAEVPLGHPVEVCYTLTNTGDIPDDQVTVTLPIPEGATYVGAGAGSNPAARRLVWRYPNLEPGASRQFCGQFAAPEPGLLTFTTTATGKTAETAVCQGDVDVVTIPAVLLEVIDLEDPIEIGQPNTYEVRVYNQGLHPLTNVGIACSLEPRQEFASGSGPTAVTGSGTAISVAPLPVLAPRSQACWQVVVKALAEGDVRFAAALTADQCDRPVEETEATRQY